MQYAGPNQLHRMLQRGSAPHVKGSNFRVYGYYITDVGRFRDYLTKTRTAQQRRCRATPGGAALHQQRLRRHGGGGRRGPRPHLHARHGSRAQPKPGSEHALALPLRASAQVRVSPSVSSAALSAFKLSLVSAGDLTADGPFLPNPGLAIP